MLGNSTFSTKVILFDLSDTSSVSCSKKTIMGLMLSCQQLYK